MGKHIPRSVARIAAVIALLAVVVPAASAIEARQSSASSSDATATVATEALYNGEVIDLAGDWNGAGACLVLPQHLDLAECFDTEAERDDRLADLDLTHLFEETPAPEGASFGAASCSSYLKLYNGYNYSGSSLWLSTRAVWLNLNSYGFNQKASSYRVGACQTIMADYNNGGGAWISLSLTAPWDVDSVISGSWNNDVSSVYIY